MASRAEQDEAARLEQLKRKDDLTQVMSTEGGRRVLSRVIYEFGALQSLDYAPDERQHAYNAGQRTVGDLLNRACFDADRALWAVMQNERTERLKLEPIHERLTTE